MRKNKLLKIFIAIVLLISIEASVIAATTGVVNTDTVRVREKPATTNSSIVGLVSIGKKVTILGEENGWYKVKAKDDSGEDIEGYIRKDLLTVDGGTTVTPTEDNNDDDNNSDGNNQGTTTGDNNSDDGKTNTSEDPDNNTGTSGGETTTNNDGATSGDATTNNNDSATTGDASGEQPSENVGVAVQVNDTTISTIKASKVGTVGQKVQLAVETKIKILPSANSSNIASLSANTEVEVLEIINSWCRIEAGEYVGWVRIDQ